MYRFRGESFKDHMRSNGLLYEDSVPLDMSIHTYLSHIAHLMAQSNQSYDFGAGRHTSSSELLCLLALIGKGNTHPRTGEVRLRPHPVMGDFTFADLVADKSRFSGITCIDNNRLVIRLCMCRIFFAPLRTDCFDCRCHDTIAYVSQVWPSPFVHSRSSVCRISL